MQKTLNLLSRVQEMLVIVKMGHLASRQWVCWDAGHSGHKKGRPSKNGTVTTLRDT